MKVMLDNEKHEEVKTNDETVIHDIKNKLLDKQETLKEITFEFDSNTGSTLINLETLKT